MGIGVLKVWSQVHLYGHFGIPFHKRPGYMSPAALFTFSERAGLLLLVETSAVSASAIIGLLSYIAVCGARDLPRSRLNGQFFS
jgi:hypothetical protein